MALIRWDPLREIERLEPFRELDRWDPLREMDTLQRRMNRLFERIIPTDGGERGGITFIPAAELEETDDAFKLRLELPGLEAKDVNVEVTPEAVSITGERKSETTTEKEGYTRSEFRYGKFQRIIPLPSLVQHEQVQAEYKDGILRLNLPKAEPEKQKAFKVNLG
ncbi:Hsp20/alpha crystallin family protein [Anabaena cylindrica FACHB-243]|uniref:Heat shock protein Hsp20 n=1 Tax=Anabaena cylindrica (strain ATCC 27899 / PCC 7122) TaxID=272123 RepID=K9ZNA3_ANACC|nr:MULTISPECIES: Hsp20/alpha crystallin family protein [Anabaena]AFZ60698.1 heat shock protein Hsp20 [Anabaena cylindrica PCC 7122]MBD2419521.1 Hsp20/alpha crystallin family protein [Anabaena cylindrica FACHB-243]MBY5282221.1 Hsp20/alpha crystallin family protein [Anabaena sp. CCAP 1446/1C]MBY5309118.1 Hsp20/alpha crystallin family protein [Anabaena sp. CCAP 1446/1C]MCM2409715.1 Hsp20/alpha crystallin family protein [Anabaena sp. CCAP 1446/1C]